ncbi:MAG: glycosyltransferase family 9 protein [Deltaproteobacteria bacterium]|nr:glycosyltransferase family 9 protein [Deltaproteobacteria bacterium]
MAFPNNPFQNILFIRTDRLGDFLLNLPAIHALKETYPKARLSVLLHPSLEELLKDHPDIDETISFAPIIHGTHFLKWFLFFWKLRKKHYDLVIISNPHKYFHLFTTLMRIPYRIGYHRKWGFLLTQALPDLRVQSLKHEVEYNLDLVALVGAKLRNVGASQNYSIPLSTQDEQSFESLAQQKELNLKKPWIVMNPYTTASFKQWPIDCFIQIVQKLHAETSFQLILIGGPEESTFIKKDILPFIAPSVFDFSGCLNLKQLAALLKKAPLLISNDSGPVHIAAAFHTKTIVLFGKHPQGSNPQRWGPWDPLNNTGHRIIQKDRITDIEIQDVWKQIQNYKLLSS